MMPLFWSLVGVALATCVLWFLALLENARTSRGSWRGLFVGQKRGGRCSRVSKTEDRTDLSRWEDDGGQADNPKAA